MLLVLAAKTMVLGGCMLPISAAALGVGVLFAGYNIALARNPEEAETLFNGALMGFALIETFIFMSFGVSAVVYILTIGGGHPPGLCSLYGKGTSPLSFCYSSARGAA